MADLESDFILDDLAEEAFPYLDELRESGETNMFGAPKYVMEEFGVDKQMAIRVVQAWMYSFEKRNDSTN
jgi:hypothetical protein